MSGNLLRKYSADKLVWIDLNADKTRGTIGISKHGVKASGEFLAVNLERGRESSLSAVGLVTVVESTMGAFHVETPVACRIDSVNVAAANEPEIIGQEPENATEKGGWLVKVIVDRQGISDFDGLGSDGTKGDQVEEE